MKHLTFATLLILMFTSCRTSFEGVVTFKIDIDHPVSNETMYKKYGDTLKVVYYPNGDMARIHLNSDDTIGLNYQYYYADMGEIHYVFNSGRRDVYSVSKYTNKKVEEWEIHDKLIANEECACYYAKALGKYSDTVYIEACYPKNKAKYYLNHRLYKTYEDYWLHQLYKKYKVPYYQYYMQFDDYKLHYNGIKIEKKKVSEEYRPDKLSKI